MTDKWLKRMLCKRKPIRLRRRWSRQTDLLILWVITRIDGYKMPLSSNHLSRDLLVM